MPRLRINDDELWPLTDPKYRAAALALIIHDMELALFAGPADREECRELRRLAILLAGLSTANTRPMMLSPIMAALDTAKEPLQYSIGDDDEQDEEGA
jgi:hypothetical protein